jgi:hypothetical protein
MPSGVVAVTGGVATDVGISVTPVVVVDVSPRVISVGSETNVALGSCCEPSITVNTPMATTAPAPATADSFLT